MRHSSTTSSTPDHDGGEDFQMVLSVNSERVVAFSTKSALSILMVLFAWLFTTYIGWVGYSISDSFEYSAYANSLHEAPHYFWQFRMPTILAIRASFLIFGASEFAACVPNLLASVAILGAVAWFVDWPRTIDWKSQSAMLICATLPFDVEFRSIPTPSYIAAGMLALGTVALLKSTSLGRIVGVFLLAAAFITHEINFFYVAILCFTTLAFDFHKYWKPVLACVAIAASLLLAEGVVYRWLLDDPLARWRAAGATANIENDDANRRFGGSWLLFYLWPVKILFFEKRWAFAFLLLATSGGFAWRRMSIEQRILFVTSIFFWFWLGYGTQVPWDYRPRSRAFHYYIPLIFGFAALLPYVLSIALSARKRLAQFGIVFVLLCNVLLIAVENTYTQHVEISRDLLRYAQHHPEEMFLTDLCTFNEMYVLNGFAPPSNVVQLAQLRELRGRIDEEEEANARNERPSGFGPVRRSWFRDYREWRGDRVPLIEASEISAILLNLEQRTDQPQWKTFAEYLKENDGHRVHIAPASDRLLCVPLRWCIGRRSWMAKSRGGELVVVSSADVNVSGFDVVTSR